MSPFFMAYAVGDPGDTRNTPNRKVYIRNDQLQWFSLLDFDDRSVARKLLTCQWDLKGDTKLGDLTDDPLTKDDPRSLGTVSMFHGTHTSDYQVSTAERHLPHRMFLSYSDCYFGHAGRDSSKYPEKSSSKSVSARYRVNYDLAADRDSSTKSVNLFEMMDDVVGVLERYTDNFGHLQEDVSSDGPVSTA
jgi:hypothetical protein